MGQPSREANAGGGPANYQKYFVPAIGAPLATALVEAAAPEAGQRVLDVACGTGVVTRLAAERVGPEGAVTGLDVNPGMLAVARTVPAKGAPIEWRESSAEKLPFPDHGFDLVTCQMGLQFFANRAEALREQRRVLAPGGRVAINLPGPTPPLFQALAGALARNVGPQATGFVHAVFSLHDEGEIRALVTDAGFRDVRVDAVTAKLLLPPPSEFMWQYVQSTPLAGAIEPIGEERRAALEREVCAEWREAEVDGGLSLAVRVTTVTARA